MPVARVVLDACVLFPSSVRDTLLRTADAGFYQVYWSDELLEEVQRNIVRRGTVSAEQAQRLIQMMKRYFPEALVDKTDYQTLIEQMTNDPKDRHVLATAVACRAQTIVTFNLRDFPQEALQPFGIKAQSPDTFLTEFFHSAPAQMYEIIKTQAESLHNPPKTIDELFNTLSQHVPHFVQLGQIAMKNATPHAE